VAFKNAEPKANLERELQRSPSKAADNLRLHAGYRIEKL
jgi:hypothetical protein